MKYAKQKVSLSRLYQPKRGHNMKKHTNDFKENIKKLGRELDAIITYNLNDTKYILTSEDLNNVTPY